MLLVKDHELSIIRHFNTMICNSNNLHWTFQQVYLSFINLHYMLCVLNAVPSGLFCFKLFGHILIATNELPCRYNSVFLADATVVSQWLWSFNWYSFYVKRVSSVHITKFGFDICAPFRHRTWMVILCKCKGYPVALFIAQFYFVLSNRMILLDMRIHSS